MTQTHLPQWFPSELRRDLAAREPLTLERRTIVVRDEATGAWRLLGCVMRPSADSMSFSEQRIDYGTVLLRADLVPAAALEQFVTDLPNRLCDLTAKTVSSEFWPDCVKEDVPLRNHSMEQPGVIYSWRSKEQPQPPSRPMLKLDAPYYSDAYEAAKDWLGLAQYSGQSDGRKGYVMLLLPETRAYLSGFSWDEDDEHLRLEVSGTTVGSGSLFFKGAYWQDGRITQLAGKVEGTAASLVIPRDADRLELFLLDEVGAVYEQHAESLGWGRDKRFLGARHRVQAGEVAKALSKGEGPQIEFKPFIQLPKHKAPLKPDARHKLDEILETIAAFSNAEGGTIFMGIANDFRVVGISAGLKIWAEGEPDKEALERYVGALKAHLRDAMQMPVDIAVKAVEHQSEWLVLIEVPRSGTPVSVKSKGIFWRRVGAGNMKVPPEDWALRPKTPWDLQ